MMANKSRRVFVLHTPSSEMLLEKSSLTEDNCLHIFMLAKIYKIG